MHKKGLTFLEIVIALSILTIALVGYFQIFNTALNSNHRATQEIIATNLARGLMAEIMSKEFVEPGSGDPPPALGPDSGETDRFNGFDDVDDYHGLSESPPITVGNVVMDGTIPGVPNYSNFTRSVEVTYCTIIGITSENRNVVPDVGPTDYKQITITVSGSYLKDLKIIELKINN